MSFLDDIFGGGGKSDAWYMQQAKKEARRTERLDKKAAKKERQRMEQEQADQEARDAELEASRRASGTADANAYFQGMGLDPAAYSSDIDRAIESAINGGYTDLSGVGKNLYNDLSSGLQERTLRQFDQFAPSDFALDRIPNTADDAIIQGLIDQGRGKADSYVQNLLKRGVVTQAGADAAGRALDDQTGNVRGLLTELGDTILGGGRADLQALADRGRLAASSIKLGDIFDTSKYQGNIDDAFNDFIGSLGDKFAVQAPKSLFDTSGLAVTAGAAQGAGNTKFDPKATAGLFGQSSDDDEESKYDPLAIF